MKNFSTNWYLYKTINTKEDKPIEKAIIDIQSEELKNKLNKIKQAFK